MILRTIVALLPRRSLGARIVCYCCIIMASAAAARRKRRETLATAIARGERPPPDHVDPEAFQRWILWGITGRRSSGLVGGGTFTIGLGELHLSSPYYLPV